MGNHLCAVWQRHKLAPAALVHAGKAALPVRCTVCKVRDVRDVNAGDEVGAVDHRVDSADCQIGDGFETVHQQIHDLFSQR